MQVTLPKGFYKHQYSELLGNQECKNIIPVVQTNDNVSAIQLIGFPGIELAVSTGSTISSANRGSCELDGVPFFVNGTTLYELSEVLVDGSLTYTATSRGTITGTGEVSMADNGTQLMILVPGKDGNDSTGYIYTVADGLSAITDTDFLASGNPQKVVYIDSYFACTTDTKKWIVSNNNDGTSWDALDFGSAEKDPDNIVAPVVYGGLMLVVGTETTQGFSNIGGSGFPFQYNGVVYDTGCFAASSLVSIGAKFFMIGGGKGDLPTVQCFDGEEFLKVSNEAVDSALAAYSKSDIEEAKAVAFTLLGYPIVVFNFNDRSLAYVVTTGMWFELKSLVTYEGFTSELRWRVTSIVKAYGKLFVGDFLNGNIGYLSFDAVKEYDSYFYKEFTLPLFSNEGKAFKCPLVKLTMDYKQLTSDGNKAVVAMAKSTDCKTYGQWKSRELRSKTKWYKNGLFRTHGLLKFSFTDAAKFTVLRADVDLIA